MGEGSKFLEDLDLALEENFVDIIFEEAEVDHFDGDWQAGFILTTLVDLAGVAFADGIIESVGVALYFFAGEGAAHFSERKLWNNNI